MIKYIFIDIDGTLTDGKIYIGNNGEMFKAFSVKDGYAINYILKKANIIPVVITARKSIIVEQRCKELGINEIVQGVLDKKEVINRYLNQGSLAEFAYFGDDALDFECIELIKTNGGITGCPNDAHNDIKLVADYICSNKGGEGAFREFCEYITNESSIEKNYADTIKKTLEFIKNINVNDFKINQLYRFEDFHMKVLEYETKKEEDCVFESHKKYIDLQYMISGEEIIKIANINTCKKVSDYDNVNDIIIYELKNDITEILLKESSYIVLYPSDAHIGGIKSLQKSLVKKIVCKINI